MGESSVKAEEDMMSQTYSAFEKTVRRRVLVGALNHWVARCGGFNTVGDLQQFSLNYRYAEPWQYGHLARAFKIVIPPGYEKARAA